MNNTKSYTHATFILFASFLMFGCNKNKKDLKKEVPKAQIVVSEKVAAENIFNYYGRNEKYNSVVILVPDTAFSLIQQPNYGYYLNGPRLFFKAVFDTNYIVQHEWKVGMDPLTRTGASFALDFEQPVGSINIRLITRYSPKSGTGFSGTDTTNQIITITENTPLFGEYEGYNTDNPGHIFRIKIGWQYEPNPALNRSYFAISNLPEGYPIKSEINPRSSCFGIDGATIIGGQALFFENEWVNSVYALGFMNKRKDSINIKYNYGIIANYPQNSMDWSRVVVKTFIGKKL